MVCSCILPLMSESKSIVSQGLKNSPGVALGAVESVPSVWTCKQGMLMSYCLWSCQPKWHRTIKVFLLMRILHWRHDITVTVTYLLPQCSIKTSCWGLSRQYGNEWQKLMSKKYLVDLCVFLPILFMTLILALSWVICWVLDLVRFTVCNRVQNLSKSSLPLSFATYSSIRDQTTTTIKKNWRYHIYWDLNWD